MQTVFITGAGGFVGSRLLGYLREQGCDVVAGVRNRARKLAYERQSNKALVCEVTDPINVARAIAGVRPDAIIHLAGPSRPVDASADPLAAYQGIVSSWANLLDAVRRVVPRAKVVLASACDVYGNAGSSGELLSETTLPQPVTTFGSMKTTAEDVAHTYYRDYHLNITIARPFHYTGPGQSERFFFGAVAQQLANWDPAANDRELRLPDLSCRRDLLHVDDVVSAYARLLQDGRPNEIYNICSGEAFTCREIIETMIGDLGHEIQLSELPGDEEHDQIPFLRGDNSKIRAELSWSPTRSARDAVRALLASYQTSTTAAAP
ncbi:MAG: GDP-mannose 4,6-dehydratase [Phycisphaerae bacterium]|nr:GDP-mannose 4,6-dehydratase [Phycisphaerae bacterium]